LLIIYPIAVEALFASVDLLKAKRTEKHVAVVYGAAALSATPGILGVFSTVPRQPIAQTIGLAFFSSDALLPFFLAFRIIAGHLAPVQMRDVGPAKQAGMFSIIQGLKKALMSRLRAGPSRFALRRAGKALRRRRVMKRSL